MSNRLIFSVESREARRAKLIGLAESGLKERAHLQE